MVGQEILVLFIMVRIRAPQPKLNNTPNGVFFNFHGARIRQSEAHGEYADEQLATAQKRIFLIRVFALRLVIVYQGLVRIPESKTNTLSSVRKSNFDFLSF